MGLLLGLRPELTRYLPGNVLLTTKENLNIGSSAGAEVIADAEIGKWATVNLSGTCSMTG